MLNYRVQSMPDGCWNCSKALVFQDAPPFIYVCNHDKACNYVIERDCYYALLIWGKEYKRVVEELGKCDYYEGVN